MLSVRKLSKEQVREADRIIYDMEMLDIRIEDMLNKRIRTSDDRKENDILKLKRCYLFCRLSNIFEGISELSDDDHEYNESD